MDGGTGSSVGPVGLSPVGVVAPGGLETAGDAESSRHDASAGIREEASFFGAGSLKRFGILHAPIGEPAAGLVICCPYQAEIHRNYRREVLLARRLAERGIAVQRFHYVGSGHSDGDPSSVTFDTMRDDALSAGDELARRTGVSTVGFLGTRWGGMVAASAAASRGGNLCLWEPVVDPARYFDEIFRFLLLYELKEDPASPLAQDASLPDLLRRDGSVDVLGHTVERAIFESSRGLALSELAPDPSQAVLLVQISAGRSLRSEYTGLAEAWRQRGLDMQTHVIRDQETWWISGDRWPIHEVHPPTTKLIDLTTTWMQDRLIGSGGG